MKKILFVFNGIVKNNNVIGVSGGDVRLFEIIKNTKNFDKYILTTPNGKELINRFGVKYTKSFTINYSVKSGIFSNLLISFMSLFLLPKELRSYNGYVYSSCEHLYDVLPALRLKILNRCKWYAVYHWVEDYPWKEKRGNTPAIIRYVYWLNRWLSGQIIKYFSDEILAVSSVTKDKLVDIKHISTNKVKAVNCGVNLDEILKITKKYESEKGKIYDAVYMKRLNYGKGVIDLLNIWKQVVKKKKDARLVIIGDGPEYVVEQIKNFIKENNLEKNINMLGVIYDFEEKIRVLNSSKIFILPSHEENWAIVIGEAIAVGLPVIAYSLKEIVPIWKDNVEWVCIGKTKDFSEKIIKYLDNSNTRSERTKHTFKFISHLDWKVISEYEFQ